MKKILLAILLAILGAGNIKLAAAGFNPLTCNLHSWYKYECQKATHPMAHVPHIRWSTETLVLPTSATVKLMGSYGWYITWPGNGSMITNYTALARLHIKKYKRVGDSLSFICTNHVQYIFDVVGGVQTSNMLVGYLSGAEEAIDPANFIGTMISTNMEGPLIYTNITTSEQAWVIRNTGGPRTNYLTRFNLLSPYGTPFGQDVVARKDLDQIVVFDTNLAWEYFLYEGRFYFDQDRPVWERIRPIKIDEGDPGATGQIPLPPPPVE